MQCETASVEEIITEKEGKRSLLSNTHQKRSKLISTLTLSHGTLQLIRELPIEVPLSSSVKRQVFSGQIFVTMGEKNFNLF